MKKRLLIVENHPEISNIKAYFIKEVTKFGSNAKVDCQRWPLDSAVYLIVVSSPLGDLSHP